MLEHHVNQVPILRWAKLGFYQTINSLFCAAILNYFSEIQNRPIYKVSEVNELFADTKNRKILIDFITEAYKITDNAQGALFFRQNIPDEVEKRLNKLDHYPGGTGEHFFPNALMETSDPYFKNQFGMRGIQSKVILKPDNAQTFYIGNYRKTQGLREPDVEESE
jgi:hypothetical protein